MIEVDEPIYSRSNEIDLKIPRSVTIIGVGGVGGWVALNFALIGVNEINLVDPDILEESNLNRLPYKMDQIGQPKVLAMQELIRERRMCNVLPLHMKWEEIPEETRTGILANTGTDCSIVIDCRDSVTPLTDIKVAYITGGYDGTSMTIHTFPHYEEIWGEGIVRYNVTPSYIVPPMIISAVITNFVCYEMHHDESVRKEDVITFDVRNLTTILKLGVKHLNDETITTELPVVENPTKSKRKRGN